MQLDLENVSNVFNQLLALFKISLNNASILNFKELAMSIKKDMPAGRALGGLARAEKLTPERRSEIARNAALSRKPLEAIRKGNFKEDFGFDAECYVLSDGSKTAVMSQRGMAAALGIDSLSGSALKRLVQTKAIANTSVGLDLQKKLDNPLIFKDILVGGKPAQPRPVHGYDVTFLIDLCNAIIEAKTSGSLSSVQHRLADQASILLSASAKSGIQNLVYKLVGYDASKEEVVAAFRAFVREEAKKYEKEFPEELYIAWARLYEINPPVRGRSWKHKHLTVDHVYSPLAKSNGRLLALLRDARTSDGAGKKLFQFLNEIGTRALRMHLGRVLEMAESSEDKQSYENKVAQRFGGQLALRLPTA